MFNLMQKAFAAEGYDQMEVYGEREESTSIGIENDDVSLNKVSESFGIGVRVIADGSVGFASTTRKDKIKDTAERAVSLANVSQANMISFPLSYDQSDLSGCFDRSVAQMDVDELTKMVVTGTDAIDYPVIDGRISRSIGERYIMNSNGVKEKEKGTVLSSMASVMVDEVSKYWFDASRSHFSPKRVFSKAESLAKRSKGAKRPITGERKIVLSPYAQYQLFSGLLYPAINADTVQNGESFLEGSRGTDIASSSLSLVDQGCMDGGLYTRRFDRDGTPSQQTCVVDNGTLHSFLYDVRRAETEGVSSTGNGFGGYSDQPSIRPSNLEVKGERGSEIDDGLLIHNIAGVHTANETTGEFAVNITTGFEYKDGEVDPVKGGLFIGNVKDLLQTFSHFYGDRRTVDSLTTAYAVFEDQKVVSKGSV